MACTKFQIGCAVALANFSFCQSSGPMVQHYSGPVGSIIYADLYGSKRDLICIPRTFSTWGCSRWTIGPLPLHWQEIKLRDVKGASLWERLRKGCKSLIMNFRDKGPFYNLPDMHGNVGFDVSDPPHPTPRDSSSKFSYQFYWLAKCGRWKKLYKEGSFFDEAYILPTLCQTLLARYELCNRQPCK